MMPGGPSGVIGRLPAAVGPIFLDLFSRVVPAGWGVSTDGNVWVLGPGQVASVNGTDGILTVIGGGLSNPQTAALVDARLAAGRWDVLLEWTWVVAIPANTGMGAGNISWSLFVDLTDNLGLPWFQLILGRNQTGPIIPGRSDNIVELVSSGSADTIVGLPAGGYGYGKTWRARMRVDAVAGRIQARQWDAAGAEPVGWDIDVAMAALGAGPADAWTLDLNWGATADAGDASAEVAFLRIDALP